MNQKTFVTVYDAQKTELPQNIYTQQSDNSNKGKENNYVLNY